MNPLNRKKILILSLLSLGGLYLLSRVSTSSGEEPESALPADPEGYKDPPGGETVDTDVVEPESTETPEDVESTGESTKGTPPDPEGYKDPPGARPDPQDPGELA
jgi:hypothetical protein